MAKIRDEPQKQAVLQKQNYFGGGSKGNVVAPGVVVTNIDKYCEPQTTFFTFGPNIKILGSKLDIFCLGP